MKICQVIFSTNRISFLKKTLESQKAFLDYSGVTLVDKIFIDDFPIGRNDAFITNLAKSYGFNEIILHIENKGITSTWQEFFDIVKTRNYDYILHTEDDVELLMPIKVLDLVELLQKDSVLSQINLKRGPWYDHEKNDPLLTADDRSYKSYLYEKTNNFFWSLFSLYPHWISTIDYKKHYNACPSEGIIPQYLYNNYGLYSGLLKTSTGEAIVDHIGEYSKGKRVNKNEPGWVAGQSEDYTTAICSKYGTPWKNNSKKLRVNSIVIDNFYDNPDSVRKYALSLPFNVTGNYPGSRTANYLPEHTKEKIQNIIFSHAGKVTNWFESPGLTGSFQLTYSSDRSWIHSDQYNTWAAVCYLTPNPPVTGGTGLFRHKNTGSYYWNSVDNPETFDGYDKTTWDLVDVIGNVYNRLVIYKGNLFHSSLDYFGNTYNSARLFQVFFFDTEYE